MPNNVDEKVVQLTFDNKQFEKGVAQSVKSLEDLKKALELDKMSNSLHTLEQTTSSMSDNFNVLQRSVDQVSKAFTPLGRIVYKAMDDMATAIESRVKSFAKLATGMESLQAGQQKYEKYTKSVQVITNATGKSVDEVSKHLDKLLKYTDETSYDFSEMVSSIGKFTSVGIDLERAEAAMEGIANWAAKSGAGKAEANRAMYNISQAMGAGYMKLIDWKSIENANMATKEFKEMAIQTAEEMGVISKNSGITYQNFNETLRHGWLTADVMTEVLARYADTSTEFGLAAFHAAQEALTFTDAIDALKDAMSSGWMKTQEYLFGNLDEARVMWTNVANALIEFSDIFTSARNNILKSWHELGGYTAAVEAVSNAWQAFMNVAYAVRDVIASMFPPDFDEQLVAMTEHIRDITAGWKEMLGIDTYTEVSEEIDVMVNKAEQFTDTLKRGARSEGVRALQEQLVKAGYLTDKSGADGIYGHHTQEAIKKLQRDLGVKVTGAWDDATRAAAIAQKSFMDVEKKEQTKTVKNIEEVVELQKKEIDHAENLNKVLKRGNRGDAVRELQKELIRLGYLTDKSGADGIYGHYTEEAVKEFQKKVGVEVTGTWDEITMAAAKSKKAMVEVTEEEVKVYKETSGVTAQVLTLQDIVKGIASAIKTVLGIVGAGIKIVINVLKIFQPLVAVGFRVIAMFMDMFATLNEGIQTGEGVTKVSDAIVTALTPLAYLVLFVAQCINDLVEGYAYFLNINNKDNTFASFFEYLATVFAGNWIVDGFISIFSSVKDIITTTADFILSIFSSLFGAEIDETTGEPKQSGIVTFFQTILSLVGLAVQGIAYLVNGFVNTIKTLFATIGEYLGPAKDGIGGFFSSIIEDVKSGKIKTFTDFFNSLTTALDKFTPIVDKIKSAKDTFINTFNEIFDTINGESDANDTSAVTSLFKTVKAFLLTVAKFDFTKYLLPAVGALATYGFFKSAFSLESFSDVIGMIFSNNGLKSGGLNKVSFKLFGAISTIALAVGLLSMLDMSKVGEFFKSFNDWFSKTQIGIKFEKIKGDIKKWYEDTKLYFQEKFPVVFEFFKKKWNSLKDFLKFDADLTFFDNLKNKFETLKNNITKIIGTIKEKLSDFKGYILSLFKMNEEGTRLKLFDELEKLVSNFDFVTKFFESVKDRFIKAVQQIFGAADGEDPEKSGKSVFDLFGMIGRFLGKLGSFDFGKVIKTGIMALLAWGWFNGSKALKNFSEGFEFFVSKGAIKKDNIGDTALKLAASIGIVALAIGLLTKIDLGKAVAGIALAGALVFGFVQLSKQFAQIKDEAAKDLGKQLLMMAGSIALLAVGIVALMGVVKLIQADWKTALGAFGILAVMLIGLTAIELKLKKGKGEQAKINNILDMCKGVIYLVVAFAGLIEIVKRNWNGQGGWQMAAAFGILTALLGELFGIEYFLSRNSNISNVHISGILGMCVGVEILVMAFSSLISIVKSNWSDPGPMVVAFLGLISILGMLGGLMAIAKSPDSGKGSFKVGALAVFMIAFAYAFESMAEALSNAISKVKDVDISVMITFLVGMGAFIGEYIGLVAAASALTTNWTKIIGMTIAVGGMIGFAYAVGIMADGITEAINKIKGTDPETVTTFFQGMFIMLLSAAGCVAVLGVLPITVLKKGIVGLVAVGLVLSLLVAVFSAIGVASIEAFGEALWLLGQDISSFAKQIEGISWSEFKSNVDLAIQGIEILVKGLIAQSTNVVTAQTVTDQLDDIGVDLQQLNTSLATISGDAGANMSTVQSFVENIKTMVDTLNTIEVAEGVTSTITELGSAINLYYKMVNGIITDSETGEDINVDFTKIDSEQLSGAFSAIAKSVKPEDVAEIQSYADGGSNDMLKAATGINAIAEAIKSYGAIADNLDEGKITTANGIIELFASIPEKLKMGDSTFEQLFGVFDGSNESKLEGFSDDMVHIGNAVKNYIDSIKDINAGKLFMANATINFLADLNNKLPQTDGGFLGKLLFGGSALDTFGNSMSHLGGGIKEYADAIKDSDFTKVPDSLVAVDTLADISGKLEKSGGLNALVAGEKNIGSLGDGLENLGKSLNDFATVTTGFEYKQVSQQFQAIIDLISIFRSLDAMFFYDQNSRSNLNKLTEFGTGLSAVFGNIADIYNDTITIKEGTWPWSSDETMPVIDAIAGIGTALNEALAESIKKSTDGTENGMGPIQQALSETVINAAEAVKNESILAYYVETGRYLGEGLIQGFNEKYSSIIELMTNLGLDAPEELRTVTEVESPSKVFAEIGKYWMDGLARGINNTSPELFKATDAISSKVIDLLSFHSITKDDPFGYLKDYYKEAGHAFEDEMPVVKYPLNFDDSLGLLPKDYKNPVLEAAEETQEAIKDTEDVIRSAVEETIELMLKLDKNLKRGSKGDEVKQLQGYLSTLGFMPKDAKIDGKYGKITEKAVRDYQKSIGAIQSGAWDEATRTRTKEYNNENLSGLYKLRQRGTSIKRSDVDRIVQNAESYEQISDAIEKNTQASDRVINRMIFGTKDYNFDEQRMETFLFADNQAKIEELDKQLVDLYYDAAESASGHDPNFDKKQKNIMLKRRILQLEQFNYLKPSKKNSNGNYEMAYFENAYAEFLKDIGYTSKTYKYNADRQWNIEDYIDKNGGIDLLRDINSGKKNDSLSQSGWFAWNPFGDTNSYDAGYSDYEDYFAGMSDASQNTDLSSFTNPENAMALFGVSTDDFSKVASEFVSGLTEETVSQIGGSGAADKIINSLLGSINTGDKEGMMSMLQQIVPSLDFSTMGQEEVANAVGSFLGSNTGVGDNIKQGILNGIIGTLFGDGTMGVTGTNMRPVMDANSSSGLANLATTGLAITSPVSLDEATKITLSTIEEKINVLGNKFDEATQKLNQLGAYIQEGFDMVRNKDGNVYIDGDSLVGKIGSRMNRFIGAETLKVSRAK